MPRDYVSPNLRVPHLDALFPNMIEADKDLSSWPWFRKSIDHIWRVDTRNPVVGFVSRDEASVLFCNAQKFAGRKGLEVGAWRGWSTAHLIASDLASLHVVEPLLADPDWGCEFAATVRAAGGEGKVTLVPEKSPAAVTRLGEEGLRWSFAFIDGDHDGEAPRRDALATAPLMEPTAMILFHDLVSPYVAAGLFALRDLGWNVAAYQTAQMMGVAWRGAIGPIAHTPDPAQSWTAPDHLNGLAFVPEA